MKKNNEKFSQKILVSVYVRKWPFETMDEDIFPDERLFEISDSNNEKVRGQKYYSWKLLEYAMQKEFGLDMSDSGMKKISSKWCSSKCNFSISHSNNIVAVAVSTHKVGIDIEENKEDKFERMADKILHPKERLLPRPNLCKIWTDKEAIFKKSSKRHFIPQKINTIGESLYHNWLDEDGKNYSLSVATDFVDAVKLNVVKD